tara:strand:+ start:155 stop:715 length:561 start_codon:yes stop_codon:yes gene_type:complete
MMKVSFLLLFTFLNAQIALPSFQGVHKPHTTTSGTPENPLGSNMTVSNQNINSWNYMMGYAFTPQVNGTVTQLGGYFNGAKTVRLWQRSNGNFLGSVSVSSNNNWSYENLSSSVSVNAGTEYVVAVYINGGGAYQYSWGGPHTYGNVIVNTTLWKLGYNSDTYPTWNRELYTNQMYGIADITFVPN